jgi:hypothetical protein
VVQKIGSRSEKLGNFGKICVFDEKSCGKDRPLKVLQTQYSCGFAGFLMIFVIFRGIFKKLILDLYLYT